MCVILWKPKEKTVSLDLISELWDKNNDGAGYFVKTPDKPKKWLIKNGLMNKQEFLNEIREFINPEYEFATHMRIKTVGTVCAEHTHPFEWSSNEEKRWMMHNGTLRFLNPSKDSDSLMLSKILACVSTEEGHDLFKKYSEEGFGRFLSLTRGKIEVFGDNESIWDDGVWFSNKRHKEKNNYSNYGYGGSVECLWNNKENDKSKSNLVLLSKKDDPARNNILKQLGIFYANKSAVAYSPEFQTEWESDNNCDGIQTSILSRVLQLAKEDSEFKTDPLLEFYLAFAE